MTKKTTLGGQDSLKKRYLYKLSANLIGLLTSLIIQSIVPRALGPSNYGNFAFLTNFFTRVTTFFDTGTSTAFYTKLSQRLNERGLIKFYWIFILFANAIMILILPIVIILNKQELLFPGQNIKYIWFALFFSILTWTAQIISKIVDAYGFTAKGEMAKAANKILGAAIVISFFLLNKLNLTTFFLYHYFILGILTISWRYILKKNSIVLFPKVLIKLDQYKNYTKEFYSFSHPLIISSFVALFVGIFDLWLLQKFAGSIQQGFYGLSFKVGSILFLFGSAMTPLIMREFSIAFGNNNNERMRNIFKRYIPVLYLITAFFCIFLSLQANKVIIIIGGSQYRGATIAMSIMILFAVNKTLGQSTIAVLYATGKTKIYRNIVVIKNILGIIVSFFLIAPGNYYGLNLGANGLAIKMIFMQFILVNILLWYCTKFLKLSYLKFLILQLYTFSSLGIIAYLCKIIMNKFIDNIIANFILSGTIYSIGIVMLLLIFPSIFSINRKELIEKVSILKNW